MSVFQLLFLAAGVVVCVFWVLFGIFALAEKKRRAALLSLFFLALYASIWFGGFMILHPGNRVLFGALGLLAVFVVLFFLPLGKTGPPKVGPVTGRVDERDVIFARAGYEPGSERYEVYYAMRPNKKEIDDKIRRLPELLSPGGQYYDPLRSEYVASLFRLEERLATQVDGSVDAKRERVDSEEASELLKKLAFHLGAAEVGVARLNPHWVYSHVGRGPEEWGAEIKNDHPYVIAFSVEMDYAQVEDAPGIGISEETALQYLNVQRIAIVLAEYIRKLGYRARAHVSGSNYQIMLPPVGCDAGLGELGRFAYLISPKFGGRIRLGAVTTEIPLVPDEPIQFGVQDFCDKCKKCAANCPPGAIPDGQRTAVRGIEKWPLDIERCYHYWRVIGTDCGLCMKVCPFSHPDSLVHNILRQGIKRSSFARSISVYGDDVFYGKNTRFDEVRT
jgi:reductive dehalogenase